MKVTRSSCISARVGATKNGRYAVGVRAHSGWAVAAVASGSLRTPLVLQRGRLNLVPSDDKALTQPYHAAAELTLSQARKLIERAERSAEQLAVEALRALLSESSANVTACAILTKKARVPDDLGATLKSHALIHAAEGNLFRAAVARAASSCGLAVHHVSEDDIEERLPSLGVNLGPPWGRGEKLASLAALVCVTQAA